MRIQPSAPRFRAEGHRLPCVPLVTQYAPDAPCCKSPHFHSCFYFRCISSFIMGQKKRRKSRVWGYLLFASTKIIYFRLKVAKKRSIAVQYRLKRSISLGKTKYNLPIPFQINNQTKKIIMAVATMAAQPFIMCPSIFLSHSVA